MFAAAAGFAKFADLTVLGLTVASVYAIAAGGLVVTYTTSGIFNFAHGAFGMIAAFTYWQFHFGWGWPTWVSLIMVLGVVAPAFGALVELVVMRRLTGTSDTVKVVVTVSLLIFLLALANLVWKPKGRPFPQFFAGSVLKIGSVNVAYHRIITLGVALLVALALRLFLYRTRVGIAMRAVVDDRPLVRLNGARPDRIAMLSWALGSSLAALSGVLIAPILTLNAFVLTILVVNTYAAAVVGRLKSLPMTFLGAIILALLEIYVGGYVKASWSIGGFSMSGLKSAVAPLMLFAVLAFMPSARLRSAGVQRQREHWPAPSMTLAVGGAAGLVVSTIALTQLMAPVDLVRLTACFFSAIVCLSLVPLAGYAGQISLAQLTFAGIGAVIVGKVGADQSFVGMMIGVAACAVLGARVALPALRLTGIYLALATAAFAMLSIPMLFNQPKVSPTGNFQTPRMGIGSFRISTERGQVIMMAVVFGLLGIGLAKIRSGRWGRRLAAMKDSPVACATLGLDLTRTKVGVFALSAAIAGMGGAISSKTFNGDELQLTASMPYTMMAVVGGVGAVAGALFGGFLLSSFSIFAALFKTNAIGLFRFAEISVPDATGLMPGFIGVSLGRNPNGAVSEIAVGYRPVGQSPPALATSIAVAVLLWVLAWQEVIGNWTFVVALIVFALGVVPLLPIAFATPRQPRQMAAGALGIAITTVVCLADWSSLIESNGMRVVAAFALALATAIVGLAVAGALVAQFPDPLPSPDLMGLDAPLSRSDVLEADRVLGLSAADLEVVAAAPGVSYQLADVVAAGGS